MRHLLAKDLRLLAPSAWLIVPAHVLWCAQAFLVPDLYLWLSLAAACAWTVTLLAIDWRMDADRLLGSLPVTRAAVVRARYVGAFAALAVASVLYVAYGHALEAAGGERLVQWHGTQGWASAASVGAFLLAGYVLTIGFLPFVFRLGLPLGAAWFSVAATAAGLAAAGLSRLGRSTDLAAPVAGAPAGQVAGGAVQAWLATLSAAWGAVPATMAVTGLAAIAGALSLTLSIRFYEAREL